MHKISGRRGFHRVELHDPDSEEASHGITQHTGTNRQGEAGGRNHQSRASVPWASPNPIFAATLQPPARGSWGRLAIPHGDK